MAYMVRIQDDDGEFSEFGISYEALSLLRIAALASLFGAERATEGDDADVSADVLLFLEGLERLL